MNTWKRRIRGALGVGLAWGLAWLGAGLILLLIVGFGAADVPFPLGFGMFGFLTGTIFSLLLGLAERGRRLEQMSIGRFAAWGGVAGFVLASLFALAAAVAGETTPLEHLGLIGPVFAIAGAVSAAGSLALARRSSDRSALGSGTRPSLPGESR